MKRLILRLPSELSKRAVAAARKHRVSLPDYVLLALESQLKAEEEGAAARPEPVEDDEETLRRRASHLRAPAPRSRREREPRRAKPPNRR